MTVRVTPRASPDALEHQLQPLGVLRLDVQQRAGLAGDRVRRDDAGFALHGALDRLAGDVALAVEVDERLGVPAERLRVDDRRVAEDHAVALEPVDAPLDGGRGQVHVSPDVEV